MLYTGVLLKNSLKKLKGLLFWKLEQNKKLKRLLFWNGGGNCFESLKTFYYAIPNTITSIILIHWQAYPDISFKMNFFKVTIISVLTCSIY